MWPTVAAWASQGREGASERHDERDERDPPCGRVHSLSGCDEEVEGGMGCLHPRETATGVKKESSPRALGTPRPLRVRRRMGARESLGNHTSAVGMGIVSRRMGSLASNARSKEESSVFVNEGRVWGSKEVLADAAETASREMGGDAAAAETACKVVLPKKWTKPRPMGGLRGKRVGEAKVPGPYTEGGASGSGATWEPAGHGIWTRKDGHRAQWHTTDRPRRRVMSPRTRELVIQRSTRRKAKTP